MSSSDAPRFADLLSRSALEAAWDHVSTGSEAAGIDRVTPAQFAEGAAARLDALHAALHGGGYKPMPARRIVLPDDPARPIAVSTVVDRVVQRALAVGLSPFYEARFTDDAWAYRPGRGVTAALEVVERHLANGRCWIGRTDISKFFDRIDRARLLAELADDGLDEPTVRLVDRLLRAGTVAGCARHDPGLGTPQGSALSPLLSNVYLRPVDRVMAARGVPYLRYADDILVLAETEPGLGDAFEILVQAVEARGLQLNARKTSRGHLGGGFVFLGARFDATGRWLAKGAVEALAARAVEVLDKPVRQVELIEEWRRWYGPVAPAVDVPLPVLAAAVQAAAKRDDEATLVAWARARPAAEGRLPVADHIRLVERWMAVDHPAADRAAVVDAQRVAEAARVERTWDRLARALGVTGEVARALGAGEAGWPALLGAAGLGRLAEAARGLARRPKGRVARAEVDPEALAAFMDRLAGRDTSHGVEVGDGHHWQVEVRPGAVEAQAVRLHLGGGPRQASVMVRHDGTVRFAFLQLRIRRQAMLPPWVAEGPGAGARWEALEALAHDHAVRCVRAAGALGWPAHLECDGGRGRRVWLFFGAPIPLRHARAALARLEDEVGRPPDALSRQRWPAMDQVRRGPGPVVVLPLGRDPSSGRASRWLTGAGAPFEDELEALLEADVVPVEAVKAVILSGPVAEASLGSAHDPLLVALGELPRARLTLQGCALLRALAHKGKRLGRLEGLERASLYESLGHLPEAERSEALVTVFRPAGEEPNRVQRRLRRLPGMPISCPALRKRHGSLAAEVGCECRFGALPGACYPTPVLHALRVEQVPAFRDELRPKRARPESTGGSAPARSGPARSAPVAVPALGALVGKVSNLQTQLESAERGLARALRALAKALDDQGVERARVGEVVVQRTPAGLTVGGQALVVPAE